MSLFADRVYETTTTTGTGTYTLGGAQTDYRGFADAFANGATVVYFCHNADFSIWERGYGTLATGAGTITRNLLDSSTGALINWTAGTKYIGSFDAGLVLGSLAAMNTGTSRPGWLPAKGLWVDTTASPWVLKCFDGSDDISVGEIDPTANTFRAWAGSGKAISGTVAEVLTMSAKALDTAKGANIASAATTTIWATDGNLVHVTGTTTITSFGPAAQAGAWRLVVFDGALTLTNGANLILPGGANITTAAGDAALVFAETTTQHRVAVYVKADGTAVVATTAGLADAHVRFDGATGAVDDSLNVSSVTDNGTGDFTVNFASALPVSTYTCVTNAGANDTGTGGGGRSSEPRDPTTTTCEIFVYNTTTGALSDAPSGSVYAAFFAD